MQTIGAQKRVRLKTLDALTHYNLAICFGLPIIIFVGYFIVAHLGLLGISSSIDITAVMIVCQILGPISLILYFIQRAKLRFQRIPISLSIEESKQLIRDITKEHKWAIRSFKDDTFTIKTNPGFVNHVWGQHITVKLSEGEILVNSIFDTNKGGWLITFGSNTKNTNAIKQAIMKTTLRQRSEISP